MTTCKMDKGVYIHKLTSPLQTCNFPSKYEANNRHCRT